MSQLEHLTTGDIWCPSEEYPSPGVFVQHIRDDHSYGMIVGRMGIDLLVLWSVQPRQTLYSNPCGEIPL
jgi:hypothetical protein